MPNSTKVTNPESEVVEHQPDHGVGHIKARSAIIPGMVVAAMRPQEKLDWVIVEMPSVDSDGDYVIVVSYQEWRRWVEQGRVGEMTAERLDLTEYGIVPLPEGWMQHQYLVELLPFVVPPLVQEIRANMSE